ncbi:hypothetical protein AB0M47_13275 [Hamadaea sp. NPDC051192]|uniref:hypothetical protein n=1 Tax=Hamadaea sp. NPDC051192 TaxID=3154940 RepID=UPI003428C061
MTVLSRTFGRIAAPIVIGYSWLVLVYLMARPGLPSLSAATGVVGVLYEVAQTMGKYLGFVAGTIIAFGLGWATIWLVMIGLRVLPVPKEVREIQLRRPELGDRRPSYGNFREEPTTEYVVHGVVPPELYSLGPFVDDFRWMCTQVQIFVAAPWPLAALAGYLSAVQSRWWLVAVPIMLVLLFSGYRRYILACRMLSRAGLAYAEQMHAEAERRWFEGRERAA